MLAAAGIALGLVLGLAAGGDVRRVPEMKTSLWAALIAVFLIQGVARGRVFGLEPTSAGLVIWAAASLTVCAVLSVGCARAPSSDAACAGLRVVLAGTCLNVIVVLLNQGMPVIAARGVGSQILASQGFYAHLNEATLMPWLGDVLVLRLGGTGFLLSPGDILLVVGVVVVVVGLLLSSEPVLPQHGPRPRTGTRV